MLAEVRPADSSPEIAAIDADIRAVSGVPMVNLIWRHFAALPGVLVWAWTAARPLVGSEEHAPNAMHRARASTVRVVEQEAARMLPSMGPAPIGLVIPDLVPVCIALDGLLSGG